VVNSNLLKTIKFANLSRWSVSSSFADEINAKYPLVPLSQVMKRIKEPVCVENDILYKRITVRLYGLGVLQRDELYGRDIGTKKQFIARKGQLIISRIDARNGAFGIVPDELDGAIVTNDFWLFDVNNAIPQYLSLVLSSESFQRYWEAQSSGTTNRQRIVEEEFLLSKIPLPNVNTQSQLVSKYKDQINSAENALRKASKLNDSIDDYLIDILGLSTLDYTNKSEGLIVYTRFKTLIGWGAKSNSNLIKPQDIFKSTLYDNKPLEYYCEINPKTTYPIDIEEVSFIPMECVSDIYGEISTMKAGNVSNSNGHTYFQEGDVIWAKITPCMQNGKCAIATKLKNGYGYGSTEFHVFRSNRNAIPEYIYCFLRSKRLRSVAMDYFTGSAGQQRVGTDFLEALTIPNLPIFSDNPNQLTQEIIVKKVMETKGRIKDLHNEAECIRKLAKKEFEEVIVDE